MHETEDLVLALSEAETHGRGKAESLANALSGRAGNSIAKSLASALGSGHTHARGRAQVEQGGHALGMGVARGNEEVGSSLTIDLALFRDYKRVPRGTRSGSGRGFLTVEGARSG